LLGAALGLILLALLLIGAGFSVSELGRSSIAPQSLVWIGVLLLTVPLVLLVLNRLFGLLTARYRLDRDGLYIHWGLAYEQIPIGSIRSIRAGKVLAEVTRPNLGFWWPGCLIGHAESPELGEIEFFATSGPMVLVERDIGGAIAISPPDPEAFIAGFDNARRMGSLEQIRARSYRPERLILELRSDRLALALIVLGFAIPLTLLVALIIGAPSLPDEVPFGFGPDQQPGPLVPRGRLILLPVIAGLIWLADLLLGGWFYRNDRDRPIAHVLWGAALVSGLLLVGAALQLISQ
jgi:hypothetical protein